MSSRNNILSSFRTNYSSFLKRAILVCFVMLMINEFISAQVISNNGAVISISSGAVVSNASDVNNAFGILTNHGALGLTGNFTNSATTNGNGTYTVGGNWTNNGTFTPNSSTVIFDGSGPGNIGTCTFNNTIINSTGTKTATGSLVITRDFTLNAGTFNLSNANGYIITILGNYTQTGGLFDFNIGTSGSSSMHLTGNLTNTAGTSSITTSGPGAVNGQIVFNGGAIQTVTFSNPNASIWTTYSVNSGSSVKLGSNITLTGDNSGAQYFADLVVNGTIDFGTYVINDVPNGNNPNASHFVLNSGANLITANTEGISLTGNTGSVQFLGTRSYDANANYLFNGSSSQFSGNGLTGAHNLTIANGGPAGNNSLTLSAAASVSGTLAFSSGLLGTSATNLLSITNPSNLAISGASSTSFIDGPVSWSLATGTYIFPVGKSATSSYLPFTLAASAASNPLVSVEAFGTDVGSGATLDGTLTSISHTEYWKADLNAGTFTGKVSLNRGSSLINEDIIGKSGSQVGPYSAIGGTASSPAINNSNDINSLGYFVMATAAKNCPVSTSVAPNGDQTVCQNFAANQLSATITTNGIKGTPSLQYQWYYNTSNSNTISGATLITGAISQVYTPLSGASEAGTIRYYFCVGYAADNGCGQSKASQSLASNVVKVTVNPNLPVSLSIVANPAGAICSGTNVVFTATSTNGGTTPTYQWKKNGTNVGSNSITYMDAVLANNDQITCTLTSNATCATGNPAISNTVTMTVNPNLTPTVTIAALPNGGICEGTTVTFTATAGNIAGGTVKYDFKVNGASKQSGSSYTFSSSTLANGNTVTCDIAVSGGTCLTSTSASSPSVTMNVSAPPGSASVGSDQSQCGTLTSASLGGNSPASGNGTWSIVSGGAGSFSNSGSGNSTFTADTYGTSKLRWTISNGACASNSADVLVTFYPSPTAVISGGTSPICTNTAPGIFTATGSGGTGSYTYQWYSTSGIISGATSPAYSPGELTSTVGFYCKITDGSCGTVSTPTSTVTVIPENTISLSSVSGTNAQTTCISSPITDITYATSGATSVTFSGLPLGVTGYWANNVAAINGTPSVLSGSPYTYNVTLNGGCGTVSANGTITVNKLPVTSAISGNTTPACSGIGKIYSVANTAGSSYFWTVPDEASITDGQGTNSITVSFGTKNGKVSVVETNENTCVGSKVDLPVSLAGCDLDANFSANKTSICNGITVTFTNTSTGTTGLTSYSWDFGANATPATASGIGPQLVTYSGSGSSDVSLTITDGASKTTTKSNYITILPDNTITLISGTGTDDQTTCMNTAITAIRYSTTGATNAVFEGLPDGVAGNWVGNVATISGTPSISGTYNFKVTLTGGCGVATATGILHVPLDNTIIRTSNAATEAQTLCINTVIAPITYSTSGATGASVSGLPSGVEGIWAGDVVTISGSPNVSGIFNYTVNMTGGCGSATASGTISVDAVSVGGAVSGGKSICSGTDCGTLSLIGQAGNVIKWQQSIDGNTWADISNTATIYSPGTLHQNTQFRVEVQNGTCSSVYSDVATIYVNPILTPNISLSASPGTTICAGTTVTFSATANNTGGGAVNYNFKVNGTSQQTGLGNTFTSSDLIDGGTVNCEITIVGGTCLTTTTALSNTATMKVNPNLPVSISITADANPICSGTSVIFTATPTNGGSTPAYQWKVNGINEGSNSSTYAYLPVDGDILICVLSSNATCAIGSPATSNSVTMSVNPNLPVSVSIVASSSLVCAGTLVNFTAMPVNEGAAPTYQWKVNGSKVGTNYSSFSFIPADGDVVSCDLTSSATCATGNPATSNSVSITVNSVTGGTVGSDQTIKNNHVPAPFTEITPSTGSGTLSYQWQVSQIDPFSGFSDIGGATSTTYTEKSKFKDNVYYKRITTSTIGSLTCIAESNVIRITVGKCDPPVILNQPVSPSPVCDGAGIVSIGVGADGTSPLIYQWYVDGTIPLTETDPYSGVTSAMLTITNPSVLLNGRQYTVNVSGQCSPAVTSNATNLTVNPNLPVSVSIAASTNNVCAGTSVDFTAMPVNGGTAPTYQWKLNGNDAGTGSSSYSYIPINGDVVSCVLTSNATCATGSPATSNVVIMTVNPNPTVNIGGSVTAICQGSTSGALGGLFGGGATSAFWSDGGAGGSFTNNDGNRPDLTTYTASFNTSGQVTLTLTTGGGVCGSATDSKQITINPVPTPGQIVPD